MCKVQVQGARFRGNVQGTGVRGKVQGNVQGTGVRGKVQG